ncbi:MAG: diguanylate cyclase, partial [Actinomycetes bacterium]
VTGLRDVHEQVLARQALANSQRRYRMLAENASDVVWHLDTDTVLQWVTPSIESVLGWTPDALLGKPAIGLVHPDDLSALQQWRATVFAGTTVPPFELRVRKSNGDFRWMSLQTRAITDAEGSVSGAVVALRDVHEQVIARENLARSEQMFRLAMAGAPQGMAVVGLHLAYLKVNAALCTMLGRNEAWLLSHKVPDVLAPESVETDLAVRDRLLRGEAEFDTHEVRMLTASGRVLWAQHSLALIRDEHTMPVFYVSQYQDITGARATKLDLQYRAEHDVLTGLINRGQLQDHLVDVLGRLPRAAGVPGVLFCDLDYFKTINDTYGHASGDYVLRVVAERIEAALREGDEVARLGGDEFVVVLPEVTDMPSAIGVAEKVRAAVAHPVPIGTGQVTLTLSVGVALATPGIEARRLLRNADSALYEAKNTGRDRIAVFDRDRHAGSETP